MLSLILFTSTVSLNIFFKSSSSFLQALENPISAPVLQWCKIVSRTLLLFLLPS